MIDFKELQRLISFHRKHLKAAKKLSSYIFPHDYLNQSSLLRSDRAQEIYFNDVLVALKDFLKAVKEEADETRLKELFKAAMKFLGNHYQGTQFSILNNIEHPANQLCLFIFNELYPRKASTNLFLEIFFPKVTKRINFDLLVLPDPRTGRRVPNLENLQVSVKPIKDITEWPELPQLIIDDDTVLDVTEVNTPYHILRLQEHYPQHYTQFRCYNEQTAQICQVFDSQYEEFSKFKTLREMILDTIQGLEAQGQHITGNSGDLTEYSQSKAQQSIGLFIKYLYYFEIVHNDLTNTEYGFIETLRSDVFENRFNCVEVKSRKLNDSLQSGNTRLLSL